VLVTVAHANAVHMHQTIRLRASLCHSY